MMLVIFLIEIHMLLCNDVMTSTCNDNQRNSDYKSVLTVTVVVQFVQYHNKCQNMWANTLVYEVNHLHCETNFMWQYS